MRKTSITRFIFVLLTGMIFVTGCPGPQAKPDPTPDPVDESILNTKAGVRPKNVTGTEALPEFLSEITDHIYVHESGIGEETVIISETKDDYTYNWYTGTTGNWVPVTDDEHEGYLVISIAKGTTYFIQEAVSSDGKSKAYSNVCTVICGSDKTEKIGMILYQDGQNYQLKSEYDATYGTPVGIVCEVKEDGTPKNIVSINKNLPKVSWCKYEADGYNKKIPTSTKEGKGSWNIIKANVSDSDTSGNYPIFEACNKLTDGGKTWFVPARDELIAIKMNRKAINAGMAKLPDEYKIDKFLDNGAFVSSSQSEKSVDSIWQVSFGKQDVGSVSKNDSEFNIFVAEY